MTNYRFEANARRSRQKALIFTLLFHVALIGYLTVGTQADWKKFIPPPVKELLNMDTEPVVATAQAGDEAVRP